MERLGITCSCGSLCTRGMAHCSSSMLAFSSSSCHDKHAVLPLPAAAQGPQTTVCGGLMGECLCCLRSPTSSLSPTLNSPMEVCGEAGVPCGHLSCPAVACLDDLQKLLLLGLLIGALRDLGKWQMASLCLVTIVERVRPAAGMGARVKFGMEWTERAVRPGH
jgi:hypothetical protein